MLTMVLQRSMGAVVLALGIRVALESRAAEHDALDRYLHDFEARSQSDVAHRLRVPLQGML